MALPVSAGLGWGLLVAFLLVCLLAVASYAKAARLAPGAIPLWLCSREPGDQAYFHNVLQAVEKKADGSLRFCTKCGAFKPDRTHHSAQLGQCVLVLQHWSVWCNNAVGFYNYKFYLLSLFYGMLSSAWVVAATMPEVLLLAQRTDSHAAQMEQLRKELRQQPPMSRLRQRKQRKRRPRSWPLSSN